MPTLSILGRHWHRRLLFPALLSVCTHSHALSQAEAFHLLERTGFGVRPDELATMLPLTRQQAVEHLLASLDGAMVTEPPAFSREPRPDYWADGWMSQPVMFWRINEINQLQTWWLQEMVLTPTPFTERLTLFWHNHFVSRFDNTHVTAPFLDQIQLFRKHGSDNFRSLLRQVLVDPMMLTGLDNLTNTRLHPNENLARELLELFTLGIGNYSHQDIVQVAQILAGHHVDRMAGWHYRFSPQDAVVADKHVLGTTIPASATPEQQLDMLVDILLEQPQTSRMLARKAYLEWVSSDPDEASIEHLASVLRQHDYAIRPFLRELLLSPAFWDPRNRGHLVKSPIELVVGFTRSVGLQLADYQILLDYSNALGQAPFMAPSVAGWRGGVQWLNGKALSDRQRVLRRLWQAKEQPLANTAGLTIRFASEHGDTPATMLIAVDGKILEHLRPRLGVDTRTEPGSNESGFLKPMWELARIPPERLPHTPRYVTISRKADAGANLFVNWIAINGKRYSPYHATWQQPSTGTCPTDAPRGSFYCDLSLQFDLNAPGQSEDDRAAPLNASLDYGTGRLPTHYLREQPATPKAWSEEELLQLFTRIEPLMAQAQPSDIRQALIAASLDPAYNLK